MPDAFNDPFVYSGKSMFPLLHSMDRLFVSPYTNRKIKRGDVILFTFLGQNHYTAHRVLSITMGGVKTGGDNSIQVDNWLLNPDAVIGQVTYIQRARRKIKIHGGTKGHIAGLANRTRRKIYLYTMRSLGPIYRFLVRMRLFQRLIPLKVLSKAYSFNREGKKEIRLLIGGYVIAKRRSGERCWHIRRPFHLFVDEASLPQENQP